MIEKYIIRIGIKKWIFWIPVVEICKKCVNLNKIYSPIYVSKFVNIANKFK